MLWESCLSSLMASDRRAVGGRQVPRRRIWKKMFLNTIKGNDGILLIPFKINGILVIHCKILTQSLRHQFTYRTLTLSRLGLPISSSSFLSRSDAGVLQTLNNDEIQMEFVRCFGWKKMAMKEQPWMRARQTRIASPRSLIFLKTLDPRSIWGD